MYVCVHMCMCVYKGHDRMVLVIISRFQGQRRVLIVVSQRSNPREGVTGVKGKHVGQGTM